MGNVAYYYQGRVIENVRMNNTIDGYAINGWESMKQENHSGMVDDYRNLKGDPDLIARYNKPLYIAVKLNHKVLPVGGKVIADLFIVNEKNIKGEAEIELEVKDDKGTVSFTKKQQVTVSGGVIYGQLLVQGIEFPVNNAGYTLVKATLKQNKAVICTGDDKIFAVKPDIRNIDKDLVVADTSGAIQAYLKSVGLNFKNYRSGTPAGSLLIINAFEPQQTGNPLITDLLEWVNNGNTLVVAGNFEKWAPYLAKKEIIDFRGLQQMGTTWYGGNYFVKESPLFAGLPQNCVFNWEYQCLALYNKQRWGMRLLTGETIVGCVADHKQEVYSALSIIPHGRGKIILNALDLISCIKTGKAVKLAEGDGENESVKTLSAFAGNPANVVGQQILLNLLKN